MPSTRSRTERTTSGAEHPDRQRIDADKPGDVEHWAAQLGVPPGALRSAIQRVGTDVDKIKDELAAGSAGRQQDG
jgi:hypothetical protein